MSYSCMIYFFLFTSGSNGGGSGGRLRAFASFAQNACQHREAIGAEWTQAGMQRVPRTSSRWRALLRSSQVNLQCGWSYTGALFLNECLRVEARSYGMCLLLCLSFS